MRPSPRRFWRAFCFSLAVFLAIVLFYPEHSERAVLAAFSVALCVFMALVA